MKNSRRSFVVFASLLGVLSGTSVLLMVLAPAPLAPDGSNILLAADSATALDPLFSTRIQPREGTWRYIYIHQSRTPAGNGLTLASGSQGLNDHFLIGNGDGCQDGEVQYGQRWDLQAPAAPPPGARTVDPGAISVCVVGDLDRAQPTPMQMRRLMQLVSTLQARFRIPADQVLWVDQPGLAASIGQRFPISDFRAQLLP